MVFFYQRFINLNYRVENSQDLFISNVGTVVAERPENAGKNIAAILADNGMKYLSTNMYPLDKRVP